MPNRFNCLLLAIACGLLLAGAAGANPAPVFGDLQMANDYGHVTFTRVGNTFNFTVFNDQTVAGQKICGWAFYPTATLNGIVPVTNGAPPLGWISVGWEGPVTSLGPDTTGDIRDSFVTTQDLFGIPAGGSVSGFSANWIGATLPTDLRFGVLVCRTGSTFWAQAGPNPCTPTPPVPDASTLVLAATGALAALPTLRLRRRRV